MCEPSVALECGSDQPRARLTAGPDVREHPCQPRWASFLKVSCGKTAVKTRAFRSEIIIMSVTVDSSRDEACHTHKNLRALCARLGRTTSIHLPTPLYKPVMGIFMLLPEAICCCLQTCNVYGAWVTLYCICVQSFVVTCASYRCI